MINKDQATKILKQPKRTFSSEEKKRFFILWKVSGLNKSQFCKKYDLTLSAFAKWCRALSNEKPEVPKNEWMPAVSKTKAQEEQKKPILIDPQVSSIMKLRIFLLISSLLLCLQEALHAIAVIW